MRIFCYERLMILVIELLSENQTRHIYLLYSYSFIGAK